MLYIFIGIFMYQTLGHAENFINTKSWMLVTSGRKRRGSGSYRGDGFNCNYNDDLFLSSLASTLVSFIYFYRSTNFHLNKKLF